MSRWNSGIRRHTGAYSLLCEQQFGEGAEFDGEMCACRKGYVRNLVCIHGCLRKPGMFLLKYVCCRWSVGACAAKWPEARGGGTMLVLLSSKGEVKTARDWVQRAQEVGPSVHRGPRTRKARLARPKKILGAPAGLPADTWTPSIRKEF